MSVRELVTDLYKRDADPREIWKVFELLDPSLKYLTRRFTYEAIRDGDVFCFLGPFGYSSVSDRANHTVIECMNKGIDTLNSLVSTYLDPQISQYFSAFHIDQLTVFDVVKNAYGDRARSLGRSKVVLDPVTLEKSYASLRALSLARAVRSVDTCPWVLDSFDYSDQMIENLSILLGVSNCRTSDLDQLPYIWDTRTGVEVYSQTSERAFSTRLKAGTIEEPNYGSIIIKMLIKIEFPEDVHDYIGARLFVADEEARHRLIRYFSKYKSLTGHLENFKNPERKRLSRHSNPNFKPQKFLSRKTVVDKNQKEKKLPMEIQIWTYQDLLASQNETNHDYYRKSQFLDVFPALFPKEIYLPYLEARDLI